MTIASTVFNPQHHPLFPLCFLLKSINVKKYFQVGKPQELLYDVYHTKKIAYTLESTGRMFTPILLLAHYPFRLWELSRQPPSKFYSSSKNLLN